MRSTCACVFTFFILNGTSQSTSLLVNDNVDRLIWMNSFDIHNIEGHSVFRSYDWEDSIIDNLDREEGLSQRQSVLSPIVVLGGEVQVLEDDTELSSQALIGLSIKKKFNEKFNVEAAVYGGVVDGISGLVAEPPGGEVYPGIGLYIDEGSRTSTLIDGLFAIDFSPSKVFSMELGRGKHFWGDGYRSLFLSDNPAAYPYLKLSTAVWHIHYSNLFSWQKGMLDVNASDRRFEDKFTSTHMLSWNISSRVNIQIFESIIWQSEDSLSQRGFDVNYLNPIIFYRPVEFASGSADNAIIGLGLSYKIYPSYQLYGQLAFDEFLLDEFRSGNGWWGNKFGLQVGFKGFDSFGVEGLFIQAELNLVRPFTYSHGSPVQNYSHLNEALAHPLGSNFYEGVLIAIYEWKGLEFRNQLSYTLKGYDEMGRNLGGDIFKSYVDPYQDYGNFIGQGFRSEELQNSIYLSKVYDRKSDSRVMLGYHFRSHAGDLDGTSHMFTVSIRSNFGDGFR